MAAMDASMGASGVATPPRGQSRAGQPGLSPNAKRPQTIDQVVRTDVPLLDLPQASASIYELKRKFEAIETWANGVNANAADHAQHIDLHRDKAEVHRLQNVMARTVVETAAELAQSDLRRVHAEDQERDAQRRRELDAQSALLSSGHESLTAELLTLKSELASSHNFAGGTGPAGAFTGFLISLDILITS